MDFLFATIFGFLSGMIIGLLPGLSTTVFLISFFPFFIDKSLIFCFTFYSVAISTSQYFGSVTALSFGVPGENTSLPLLSIREKLLGQINKIHFLCAAGSFISSIVSFCLFIFVILFVNDLLFYIKSYVVLICAIMGLLLCIRYSENNYSISLLFLVCGWIIGKIGYDRLSNESFLTFDNSYLYGGIPILPAILGLYAIPNIFKMFKLNPFLNGALSNNNELLQYRTTIKHIPTMIRSMLIGFFSGLIPYIGNSMSSYFAFLIEKKIDGKNYVNQSIAAESANNSANISVLIPLLTLGIAIVPSEFILLEILNSSTNMISWKKLIDNLHLVLMCLLVSNVFSFIFSWMFVHKIVSFIMTNNVFFSLLLCLLFFVCIFLFGMNYSQEYYYILVFCVFTIIGFCLHKYDLLPFVYAFLLQNNVEETIYRVTNIYFS